MKKLIIAAGLAVAMLTVYAPMASAVVGTNPVASPDTIYPYVNGGRADVTTITFDAVLDSHLSVFDEVGTLVYQKNAGPDSVTWGGQATGGGLVDPGTYQACIYNDGDDPGLAVEGFCDTVTVVHHDVYFWVDRARNGKAASGINTLGQCKVQPRRVVMRVKCRLDSTVVLRYRIAPPALTSEQTLTGDVSTWANSTDFRGHPATFSTNVGVRLVSGDGYWGRIHKVFKSFYVHEEF